MLSVAQKVEREDLAKIMLEILAKHATSNFHFLLLEMSHGCFPHITSGPCGHSVLKMWTKFIAPHMWQKKTMVTVFFNGNGLHLINILPQNQKMNAEYFLEIILPFLISVCYPDGRRSRGRKCVVHFDNAPIHNSKVFADKLTEENLKQMPHRVDLVG
jgi:hypothetical protein